MFRRRIDSEGMPLTDVASALVYTAWRIQSRAREIGSKVVGWMEQNAREAGAIFGNAYPAYRSELRREAAGLAVAQPAVAAEVVLTQAPTEPIPSEPTAL